MIMSQLLNDDVRGQVQDLFSDLKEPVEVLFFGRETDCDFCEDALHLAEEVVSLSDHLTLSVYDLDEDADIAGQYHVDKAPGMVIAARQDGENVDFGIRYAGIPSGHEFTSLVHDLLLVSNRDSRLNEETRTFLRELTEPVHLQVFVTPTCPYCPQAVLLAHQMALESPMVEAEMVEAMEFPALAQRFGVSGVPQTTINDGARRVVGAVPEARLLDEIERASRAQSAQRSP
jgi:glutaredoxin-like protein